VSPADSVKTRLPLVNLILPGHPVVENLYLPSRVGKAPQNVCGAITGVPFDQAIRVDLGVEFGRPLRHYDFVR